MPRWTFGDITGADIVAKALRANRERDQAIAFYSSFAPTTKQQTIHALANHEVTTSMGMTNGYMFRLLIIAKSPGFLQEMIRDEIVAADTVVDIHFYFKKKLKRKYTEAELFDLYQDLLALADYYKKRKILPLLAEKYFQVGRFESSSRYEDLQNEK